MKRPTVASLKKVSVENLTALGVERLAELLVAVADTRPELKRRLRMELAAQQGPEHLAPEIDRRLGSLETSRSKVSWRQRPTFVRDLDILRTLIVERLGGLDRAAALDRMWQFMEVARRVGGRVRDKHGDLAEVFARAAADIGALAHGQPRAAEGLVEAMARNPTAWSDWLPAVLEAAPPELAGAALRLMSERPGAAAGWILLARQLADAAGDVDAFQATFPPSTLKTPAAAAEVAQRLLAAGRVEEAGRLLSGAQGKGEPDFGWESLWIDYLEQSGDRAAAQGLRWASFERTLSAERARAFTSRLADFDDVEAEARAFDHAARHPDAERALQFLMDWSALPEAARMILARADELKVGEARAEEWAGRLRPRQPAAAQVLLRKASAAASRRRDHATSERLARDADAIGEG